MVVVWLKSEKKGESSEGVKRRRIRFKCRYVSRGGVSFLKVGDLFQRAVGVLDRKVHLMTEDGK